MTDARVERAFAEVPREDFLPLTERRFAALDRPLPIGHGQTNSQPTTVRRMLELLDVQPGHSVLDVGCGSGWTTALLGRLVGETGSVVGTEIVPELVGFGRENLAKVPMAWARIEAASPHTLGRPEDGPYDRILCSAEAGAVPDALVSQLAVGGVLVMPVNGRMLQVRRTSETEPPTVVKRGHYSFVPLVEPTGAADATEPQ